MTVTLPNGTTSDETLVTRFLNTDLHWQIVTDGPDATCQTCGYPERHRIYDVQIDEVTLIADGCPSCEASRMPSADVVRIWQYARGCIAHLFRNGSIAESCGHQHRTRDAAERCAAKRWPDVEIRRHDS